MGRREGATGYSALSHSPGMSLTTSAMSGLLLTLLLISSSSAQVNLSPEDRENLLNSLPPLLLNFVFPKFVLGPIDYSVLLEEENGLQTRLGAAVRQVRVDPVNFNLLEFILLNVDFNYLDQVPTDVTPDI